MKRTPKPKILDRPHLHTPSSVAVNHHYQKQLINWNPKKQSIETHVLTFHNIKKLHGLCKKISTMA